jgi:hypothetical protein
MDVCATQPHRSFKHGEIDWIEIPSQGIPRFRFLGRLLKSRTIARSSLPLVEVGWCRIVNGVVSAQMKF